jgi:hypothetical protein
LLLLLLLLLLLWGIECKRAIAGGDGASGVTARAGKRRREDNNVCPSVNKFCPSTTERYVGIILSVHQQFQVEL